MNHADPDIKSLTQSIFEIKNNLDGTAKCILDEIEKLKEKSHTKSESVTKKKTETEGKEIRIAGSFLNRKSTIKSVSNKPSQKNDKNTPILPEPDSQVNNIYYSIFIFLCLSGQYYLIFKFIIGLCVHKNRSEI